jgi:hypothetical protein
VPPTYVGFSQYLIPRVGLADFPETISSGSKLDEALEELYSIRPLAQRGYQKAKL